MKTLLMKWNFLVVLFMMCSVPLLVGCGDDDDEPISEYHGWKEIGGNKATFGAEAGYGNYKATVVYTLTFDGSGDEAKCIKCEVEETWPEESIAIEQEKDHRDDEGISNLRRNGKKITYEEDSFIGMTRKYLKDILSKI